MTDQIAQTSKPATAPKPLFEVVDDEYRTGVVTPDWWSLVQDGKTVFVADSRRTTIKVKDASLREHARREHKQLHTKKVVKNDEAGTVYWMTDKT